MTHFLNDRWLFRNVFPSKSVCSKNIARLDLTLQISNVKSKTIKWLCTDSFMICSVFPGHVMYQEVWCRPALGFKLNQHFSLSTLQHFLFPVSGSDSRHTDDKHPLTAFDGENVFSAQFREVMARMVREGSRIKGKLGAKKEDTVFNVNSHHF